MTVKRMDNVGIVAKDLGAAVEFFTELGPKGILIGLDQELRKPAGKA